MEVSAWGEGQPINQTLKEDTPPAPPFFPEANGWATSFMLGREVALLAEDAYGEARGAILPGEQWVEASSVGQQLIAHRPSDVPMAGCPIRRLTRC